MDTGNFSEKIIEFLDGELPATEEPNLFLALSVNEELRSVLKEHLAIARSVRSDFNSFIPPASAVQNIARALRFKTIEDAGSSSKPLFFAKFGRTAVLMLSTAIITFLLTYFFFRPETNTNPQSPKAIVQTPPMIISSVESSSVPKISSSPRTVYIVKENQSSDKSFAQANNKNLEEIEQTFPRPIYNNSSNNLLLETAKQDNVYRDRSLNLVLSSTSRTKNVPLAKYPESSNVHSGWDFGINLRGIAGKSFPNPNIATSNSVLNNVSLGLYFTQWDDIKFGMEFGKEVFGLSYNNEINGVQFAYEQKPALFWAAVGVDYTLPYRFYYFQPFVTFLAGGSQIGGPLVKGIGGLRYRPAYSNLELYLGAEGTMLLYQNQKVYYLTRKIGLTYGISIIF